MSYLYFASFYPADFIRNPIQTPQPGPGRGPCGFRRPGRRPGGAGHGEAVASGLSSAGDLRCLGRLVSEQYDFSTCCWKRYCCCYLYIYITYIVCVFPLCIFVCMCICTYIRTHDMCIFMSAWPRAWSIYCWKGLVWWLAILEDPMGYQSPGAPTNLPSKSLDKDRVVFLCLTLLIPTRSHHPLTDHTYYTS